MMITRAYSWFMNFPGKLNREEGQGLVEYALILLLIAMAVVVTLELTGETLNGTYENIASQIEALIP
jgi:pilus assembly protein Flp/PilA